MKIHIQTTSMMFDNTLYKAIVDYVEDGEEKYVPVETRKTLRMLFYQIKELFGDMLEEVCSAEITGEFDKELTGDDLKVWETPVKEIIKAIK